MTRHSPTYYIIFLYLLLSIAAYPFDVLRMLRLFDTAMLVRIIVPFVTISAMFLYVLAKNKTFKLDQAILTLLFVLCWGGIIGVTRGNDTYYVVSDIVSIFAAMMLYYLAYNDISSTSKEIARLFDRFSWLILVVCTVQIVFGFVCRFVLGYGLYLSFGNLFVIIPFATSLVYRRKKRFIYAVLIIFAGAKVGVMLSALFVYGFYHLLKHNKRINFFKIIVFCVIGFVFLNVIMYALKDYTPEGAGFIQSILLKLQGYNFYHSFLTNGVGLDQNLNFGSGRLSEIVYSMKSLLSMQGLPLLSGGGLGFTYDQLYRGQWLYQVHNVHFSPIGILEKFGLFFMLAFYYTWIRSILKAIKIYRIETNDEQKRAACFCFLYCLGAFVFSFTAYSIFVVLYQWVILGLLSKHLHVLQYNRPVMNRNKMMINRAC